MSLIIFTLLAAVLLFIFYTYLIHPLFLHPLSKIPSAHPTSAISSQWISWHRRGGRAGFRLLHAAHNRLGPIIRISPNELSVASLDGLRKIYLGGFEKTEWYVDEFENYGTPNLVSMLQSKPHAAQKRLITHVYSKSYIQNSKDVRRIGEVMGQRLVTVLKRLSNNTGQQENGVDVCALSQAVGADFTSAYLFGEANGTDFVRIAEAGQRYLQNWRAKVKGEAGKDRADAEIEALVLSLCRKTAGSISESLQRPETRETLTEPVVYTQLSSGLSMSSETGLDGNRELVVASEMMDHVGAGSETIKITLTYLQWELSRRPKLQSALRDELSTLSPPFKLAAGGETLRSPDPKNLEALPLLEAIVKETLRLYPPSPPLLTRIVPQIGTTIDGYDIPGGVVVGTSGFVMHMNEDIFPNASSFKPERWIGDIAKKTEMNRWFWVFGSGGRMCVGSHFVIYMLKATTAAIYTNFETEIVDDGGPEAMEQEDAFFAGPVGEKMYLRFHKVSS